MKNILKKFMIFAFFTIFLLACSKTHTSLEPELKKFHESEILKEENIIGDSEKARDIFINDNKVRSLEEVKLYKQDSRYYMVLNLLEGATKDEIDALNSYFDVRLMAFKVANYGSCPYLEEIFYSDDFKNSKGLSFIVNIGDWLAYRYDYDMEYPKITKVVYDEILSRDYEFMKADQNLKKLGKEDILIRNSFSIQPTLILNISQEEEFDEEDINKIKENFKLNAYNIKRPSGKAYRFLILNIRDAKNKYEFALDPSTEEYIKGSWREEITKDFY